MPTNPTSPAKPKKAARKPTTSDYVARVIVFLMMACFAVVVHVVAYTDFVAIKDDLWLNSHGVPARNGTLYVIHGHRTESELCAYYDTQQGKHFSRCIPLWFPFVFIDEHSPEIIHYDPASPKHISTSWGRQVLFSRTFSLMVALAFVFIIDLGLFMSIVEKFTGKGDKATGQTDQSNSPRENDQFAASPTPSLPHPIPRPSAQPIPAREPTATTGSALQSAALKLSRTLNQIVAGLQSNTGPNAAYAQATAAELAPLVAQYDQAVLVTHSREEASEALNIIVDSMSYLVADTRNRKMSFGFRHWLAMRTYSDLHDIFRDSKHRDDAL